MARSPKDWILPTVSLVALLVSAVAILAVGEADHTPMGGHKRPKGQGEKRQREKAHLSHLPPHAARRPGRGVGGRVGGRVSGGSSRGRSAANSRGRTGGLLPPVVKPSKSRLILRRPPLKRFLPQLRAVERKTLAAKMRRRTRRYPYVAVATGYRAKVYANTRGKGSAVSFIRRGVILPIKTRVTGTGCEDGNWYKEGGTGYVCTSKGFDVGPRKRPPSSDYTAPDLHRAEPYDYAKVVDDEAFRYYRPPTKKQVEATQEAAFNDERLPSIAVRQLEGDFFLAWGKEFKKDGRTYVRSPRGTYIAKDALERFPRREMHGEVLGRRVRLPLAFVYKERVPVYRIKAGEAEVTGLAQKHSRFFVKRTLKTATRRWVLDGGGHAVRRRDVRICRSRRQPKNLRGVDRWIHVDLSEQTLVAYRGQRPVFATLVSTGVPGHSTPLGLYRITHKHITTTMQGPDDEVGWYDVGEVPWTLYYRKLYAIHGAYWHENFGKRQSHGCTNVAPADAKWLFHWTRPRRPVGWHSVRDEGTHVWFTE